MTDRQILEKAVTLSKSSEEAVKSACILTKDGKIVAQTYNSPGKDDESSHHAETKAIREANMQLKSRKLDGVTAYCTCEPCITCLGAMSIARIERIVYNQRMKDLSPDDPMARLNSQEFADRYLPFSPKLERLVLS
jgi:tRNA(Arg) A34 adenosine deaminase TadA